MAAVLPAYDPGDEITCVAAAAITGGQVVEVTGVGTTPSVTNVTPTTGVSKKVLGIAPNDAASGARVLVKSDGIWDLVASGAIVAGDLVTSAAAGKVAAIGAGTFDQAIGIALCGAADAGTVRVKLLRG
jgi:predicted RecA/RadA family phage recombinase